MSSVHGKILQVMQEVGPIGKTQRNAHFNYDFRGIDDIYNVLGPKFAEVGLFVTPNVIESKVSVSDKSVHALLTVRYEFHCADTTDPGVCATVVGEGVDTSDKAVNKAMTSAYKNALFQVLCIPTNEKSDSEYSNPEAPSSDTPPSAADPAKAKAAAEAAANREIVLRFQKEAGARAKSQGLQSKKDGLRILVDSMRVIGCKDADAGNYPGLLAQCCAADSGFSHDLSAAIEVWAQTVEQQQVDADFVGEGAV